MLKPTTELGHRYRPNRFRLRLASAKTIQAEAKPLASGLTPLLMAWQSHRISEAEVAALYVLTYLRHRHQDHWLVGPTQPISHEMTRHRSANSGPFPALTDYSSWYQFNPREQGMLGSAATLPELFNRFSLRGIPLRARQALAQWLLGNWRLHLLDWIPTPQQLLAWQCGGERIVTALFAESELGEFVAGERDALGFILHDLIHAAQFFAQPEFKSGQLGFYRHLQKSLELGVFTEALIDPGFREDFEYVISDMNSHSVHLLVYLKTTMLNCIKRQFSVSSENRLNPEHERRYQMWLVELFQSWNLPEELASPLRLPSPDRTMLAQLGPKIQKFFAQAAAPHPSSLVPDSAKSEDLLV